MKKVLITISIIVCVFLLSNCIPYVNDLIPSPNPTPVYREMDKYYIPFTKVGAEMEKYWEDKGCEFSTIDEFDIELLTIINTYRAGINVKEIQINDSLNNAALGHAVDMICGDYYSHISKIETSPAIRVVSSGYSFSLLFENLNKREVSNTQIFDSAFVIAQESLDTWISSESHKLTLQNNDVTDFGAAAACAIQTKNNIPQQICLIVSEFSQPYKDN